MEHKKIRRNRLQCKLCGDIIESKYTHDYVMCSCKKCAIDGGKEYVRFSAPKPDDVIFLTEYNEKRLVNHKKRRSGTNLNGDFLLY